MDIKPAHAGIALRIRLWPVMAIGFAVPAATIAGTPPSPAQQQTAQRMMAQFETLAGSPHNARSLVQGLRTGTTITLTSKSSARRVAFTPATLPMGYGNVRRALTIAQQELAARGIVRPTPEELQAVLMGGTVRTGKGNSARQVRYSGVLPLRSVHMRWGEIAHALAISPIVRPRASPVDRTESRMAAL